MGIAAQEAPPILEISESEQIKQQPVPGLAGRSGRVRRPAAGFWHPILISIDNVLMFALCLLTPSLVSSRQTTSSLFAPGQGEILWFCLILLCWNFARYTARAQDLLYASNIFRGPFCVLLALILLTFASLIIGPLINISFGSSARIALYTLALAAPLLVGWRVLFAIVLTLPRFRRKAVIVGADRAGKMLVLELQKVSRPTIAIIGYIRDDTCNQERQDDLPVLGNKDVLHSLIHNRMIDMLIMALDYRANTDIFQEAIEAAQFGIEVLPVAVVLESVNGKVPVKYAGDQWSSVLPLEASPSLLYALWEKVVNLLFIICGLAILLLLLPVVTLLIYLESPGKIFYRQERLGLRGKPLSVYKFRSMRPDAETAGRAVWASANDPRITRFGRFMRTTHLDELPQVLNVLRGEMNLIGPRPERAEFVSELEKAIPFYRCRLAVKPGITGWAQVKYRYGNTDNDALVKLQYDLYYIKHRSFVLDAFIILKTVFEVFARRGV